MAILTVVLLAWLLARVPSWLEDTRVGEIVSSTSEDTTQSVLRWTITLLLGALLLTADFGLDIVLGAFLAGMVLRRSSNETTVGTVGLLHKLDTVGYGFFIPIFFISSGMGLDLTSIVENPERLLVFFSLLLLVRGLPVLVVYRRELPGTERLQLMFMSATGLPLIVAITEVSMTNGTMLAENGAALVGAGVLSVAVFPFVALQIRSRTRTDTTTTGSRNVVS
jgi:Kef-type K+ transport system membrane component KefB